jgi:hypothetical protein
MMKLVAIWIGIWAFGCLSLGRAGIKAAGMLEMRTDFFW